MENLQPELQQDNELEIQTELESTVGAENLEAQTPSEPEVEEYDEIVLAGEEQASQKYSTEEVLVHKLSKMRKGKSKAIEQVTVVESENAKLKEQMSQMRKDFGYEDEVPVTPSPQVAPVQQVQQIDESVFTNHYGAAAKLKVSDYQETEQALRDNLGGNVVDALIVEARDKSPIVLYHLQKNPAKLEQFKHAMATNVSDAQRMIWQMSNDLKVNKVRRDPVPAPESVIKGQSSTITPDKQLDSMRDEYVKEINSGGDGLALFKRMREFKQANKL